MKDNVTKHNLQIEASNIYVHIWIFNIYIYIHISKQNAHKKC